MRHSLRIRLLIIVLFGMALLAAINLLSSRWQLGRVRDAAIANSGGALHQQASAYLRSLAEVRADGTGATLGAVRQIADILKDYLAQASPAPAPPGAFALARDGRRYLQGATTVLLPAGGDEAALRTDLALSAPLDLVLPAQARRVPEIVRISYVSPRGLLRTFPALDLADEPLNWTAEADLTYQLGLPRNNLLQTTVWSAPHDALDGSEPVLSAVAPVYRGGEFAGTIIVDVSMERLTSYLERLRIGQSGFAFLLTNDNQLVAAPLAGQQRLIGREVSPMEQVTLDRSIPGLEPALLEMRLRHNGVATITLDQRAYLLAYAPISAISWNQALAVPLDEVTAAAAQTAGQITGIAEEARLLGLISSLLAAGLIAAIVSLVLRRQFVQPLAGLISATRSVAAGDLRPIEIAGGNEFAQLTESFNTMTSSLKGSRDEILAANQHLEQTVQERTRDLQAALGLAEDANRMKTQFLANMSHELRTPLNAIINFSQMIGLERFGGELTDRQRHLQQRIAVNADHLLGLINDILDLSKIEAGRMDLLYEEVDLDATLKGVLSTAIGLTADKGLAVTLEAPDDLPPVWVDKTRIRQVLLNLLSNAAKFTEEGVITLEAGRHDERFVRIAVRDTGIGIAPEHQALIFEEFRQVQGEMMREYQGTGLGLPISKRLVEMHGGEMWLESAPGAGSAFFFTLPVHAAAEPVQPPALALAEEAGGGLAPAGPLIAVIDDDPNAQDIMRLYLEEAGYRVAGILDSRAAIQALGAARPQLIMLDIQMPHLNGWELLAELGAHPGLADIPVVMCSVLDEQRIGLLRGADAYLSKPVRREEVLAQARQWAPPPAPVLVIDDDPDARGVIRAILGDAGHEVVEAADGAEGLRAVAAAPPALVILDLMMPVMDGFSFLAELRARPGLAELPVLVLTARDLSRQEREWLLEHAQRQLGKSPFSAPEFLSQIRQLLRRRS